MTTGAQLRGHLMIQTPRKVKQQLPEFMENSPCINKLP